MMRKVLINPYKEVTKPFQRYSLFRTSCKNRDRVCKLIIHSGSIDNLVSTKMVEKIKLEMTPHPD
jgi:hypothetical protein